MDEETVLQRNGREPDSRRAQLRPAQRVGRFELGELLGEGGMGRVFKAFDPTLERWVALKLLSSTDPSMVARFSREARLQARVRHNNVCPIYEVGEHDGQHFITMALVEGETLKSIYPRLGLNQIVEIFADAADGLHAAHRKNLIHRDVKPSNIMIEERQDGSLHALVLDFGVAQETVGEGLTQTGMVLGTPAYMAPEQVSGMVGACDRRTDVYGLGATLYEVLTSRPPFEGVTGLDLLLLVTSEDPPLPRSLNSELPRDLETIVLKCLEKEPCRRYQSARELADDLRRFREGDPIGARRAGLAYRLAKHARKHQVLSGVVITALMLLTIMLGLAVSTSWKARERELLARRFGQEVQQMETIMRIAYLLPLHDVRQAIGQVEKRLRSLEESLDKGISDVGITNYAIGRGYMALHRPHRARSYLEAAWESGLQDPEVAHALGLTLGEILLEERSRARWIPDESVKKMELERIRKELKEPALSYLRLATHLDQADHMYAEGLIALYEERHDDALDRAGQARALDPGLYEAITLQGNAHLQRSRELNLRGEVEAARESNSLAFETFTTAVEIARSDPAVHGGLCRQQMSLLVLEMSRGTVDGVVYRDGIVACDRALVANPDDSEPLNALSQLHWRWSDQLQNRGEDSAAVIGLSIAAARRSIEVDPAGNDGYNNLGVALKAVGTRKMRAGGDPTEALAQAAEAFQKALDIFPDAYATLNNLALTRWVLGDWKKSRGENPLPDYEAAASGFRAAAERFPESTTVRSNIGSILLVTGIHLSRTGHDPSEVLEEAVAVFHNTIEVNPTFAAAYNGLGASYWIHAEWRMRHGEDPRALLEKAIETFQRSIEENPDNPRIHNNMGSAAATRATYELQVGLDAEASFLAALEYFAKASEIDPVDLTCQVNAAALYTIWGLDLLDRGHDPTEVSGKAEALLLRASEVNSEASLVLEQAVQLSLLKAKWERIRGVSPRVELDKARRVIRYALEVNPGDPALHQVAAKVCLARASELGSSRQLILTEIGSGLDFVTTALDLDPEFSEAFKIRGQLLLLQAGMTAEASSERAAVVTESLTAFSAALALNPLLAREIEEPQAAAQALETKSLRR